MDSARSNRRVPILAPVADVRQMSINAYHMANTGLFSRLGCHNESSGSGLFPRCTRHWCGGTNDASSLTSAEQHESELLVKRDSL
jgi:hypothetical protein